MALVKDVKLIRKTVNGLIAMAIKKAKVSLAIDLIKPVSHKTKSCCAVGACLIAKLGYERAKKYTGREGVIKAASLLNITVDDLSHIEDGFEFGANSKCAYHNSRSVSLTGIGRNIRRKHIRKPAREEG